MSIKQSKVLSTLTLVENIRCHQWKNFSLPIDSWRRPHYVCCLKPNDGLDLGDHHIVAYTEHCLNLQHNMNRIGFNQIFWGGEAEIRLVLAHNKHENVNRIQEGGTAMMALGWQERMKPDLEDGWLWLCPDTKVSKQEYYVAIIPAAIAILSLEQYMHSIGGSFSIEAV